MHRQPAMRLGAATLLVAAGLAAAFALNPSDANAYTINQLPNMGFGVLVNFLPQNGCHDYKVGWRNDPKTELGSDCDPGFQANLDAFMASHCPPFVCPENAATTVTTTQTETDTLLAPAPDAVTTTLALPVALPDDDPAPPADDDQPAPVPPTAAFIAPSDGLSTDVKDTAGNTNVVWMFGDGTNGSGTTAAHRYAKPGRYVIAENVVNADGLAAQTTRTVTVSDVLSNARTAALLR